MLQALVKDRARQIGFDLVGIAPVEATDDLNFSREWLSRGYAGEMEYLRNPKREDLRLVLPSAQSVVCVGLIYNAPLPYSTEVGSRELGEGSRDLERLEEEPSIHPISQSPNRSMLRGWISRYAWGSDYHEIMRAKLEELRRAVEAMAPGAETRVYVDTGPIVERAFARLSGIGWTGKNTCLINQEKGSWFFLGVLITNLELSPDLPAPDHCGTCTACLDACPTQALVEPYVMDASRCIAYFTIELKGSIPEEFRPAIGNNVVGCDICQDVCPWNSRPVPVVNRPSEEEGSQETGVRSQNESGRRHAATTGLEAFQPKVVGVRKGEPGGSQFESDRTTDKEPRTMDVLGESFSLFNPPLDKLAALTEEDFRQTFKDSPIKRVKYRGWLRNICVAMGNAGEAGFLPKLRELTQHADPIVREHAEWAIAQITKRNSLASAIPTAAVVEKRPS